ncbi:MAG: TonB-dependent receptor [Pseudomonadales bacterium]|nr:TonB-dependent receptor [Pseudomonadales bacterium]MDP7359399.1 TonB-dependent receptor [Pseudomonadales bacterium]MDP7596379.1 TonB-dependent receptor [Pseudomonadales bacterium]HJN48943.1 TonB-dependent receptor [Pseudomonadales bacterium]
MFVRNRFHANLTMLLLATSFLQGTPALAAPGNESLLEEIIVTARKRMEGLQDAPMSVTAFTADSLEYRGTDNLGQIADFTPNMTFQNNPSFGGASNTAAIYLRGIGQKEFLPTTEPGVGLYVDGAYIARSVGAILDILDMEQIEILRGPQGTLFGRNTIGGAINIVTRKPNEQFSASGELTLGTDDRANLKGYINGALADGFYANLSLASMNQDGYVSRPDGTDLGDDDTRLARLALRWVATDQLEFNLTAELNHERENGPPLTLAGINYGLPIDAVNTPPFVLIHNVGANAMATGVEAPCATFGTPLNLDVPGCYDDRYVVGDSVSLGTAPAFSETDIEAFNLRINWHLTDRLELRSISAYRELDSEFGRDGDHSPHTISEFIDLMDQEQFTQEIQLLGTSLDNRLNWILGFYFFDESGNNVNLLDFTVSNFRSGGRFDNESSAFYLQGTYDLTDTLHLTAGLRVTDETKQFLPDQIIFNNWFAGTGHPQLDAPFMQAGNRILPFIEKEIDIKETSPLINLAYDVNSDLMIYTSYSEGFKSGGFSQRVFPPIVAPFTAPAGTPDIDLIPTFEPEFVQAFEVGFKYMGAGGRLRLNGAVFNTEYDDLQIQVFTSVAPVTKNAANAEINGFELELQWLPGDQWLVELGAGYVDAAYNRIDAATTFVAKGNDLERISKWTLNLGLSKDLNLGSMGRLTPRLDWSYRSKFFNDTFNTPQIAQRKGYHLANVSIAWQNPGEEWRVTLAVENLTDEEYLITGIIGDAFQSYETLYNRGREWRLRFQYNL